MLFYGSLSWPKRIEHINHRGKSRDEIIVKYFPFGISDLPSTSLWTSVHPSRFFLNTKSIAWYGFLFKVYSFVAYWVKKKVFLFVWQHFRFSWIRTTNKLLPKPNNCYTTGVLYGPLHLVRVYKYVADVWLLTKSGAILENYLNVARKTYLEKEWRVIIILKSVFKYASMTLKNRFPNDQWR